MAEFERQREGWRYALREQVFRGWPSAEEAGPLDVRSPAPAFTVVADGMRLSAYDFNSQPTVKLRLYLFHRAGAKKMDAIELAALDDYAWLQWRQAMQVAFADVLKDEMPADADERSYKVIRERVANSDLVLAFVCPRGVGPTAWDQSEKKQVQHRRRFMLLGQTLDGMQVWDIRRAVQAIKSMQTGEAAPLHLRGERVMAGNVLYASLFEGGIKQVELRHLKPTHREGPIYMNISKHMDIPQAVVLAATRCPVKLDMALAGDWEYVAAASKTLGWDEKQVQITIAPPPVPAPPPNPAQSK